jgi:hypothetical protein
MNSRKYSNREQTRIAILRKWLDKVDRSGDCWKWLAHKNNKGYGAQRVHGKNWLAHRLGVWLLGVDPGKLSVCHKCDNPECVRPSHMFLGTQKDNIQDMVRKGRQNHPDRRGVAHPGAKLTEADVCAIRATSDSISTLAQRFGVRKQTISSIKKGRLWGHV